MPAVASAPPAWAIMATLSRKTVYLALLSLIILSVALRYPLVDHERNQTDSYFIHGLANDITAHGMARWTIHPLSYFGYYPLSYPSGVPFLLSEFQVTSEVPLEAAVLMMGMALGTLACLTLFCFLRMFIARTEYVLLGTYLCMVSSRFVDTTYWVGTARGPLAVLIILTVLVVLAAGRRANLRLMFVGVLLAISCTTVHHMAVFLFLFALAYIVVTIGYEYFGSDGILGRRSSVVFYGAITCTLVIVVFGTSTYLRLLATSNLGSTELFDFEPRFLSVTINAAISYSSQIGFIVPLAFLGIPYLLLRSPASPVNMYPLAVIIVFIPLIGYSLYLSLVIAPFFVALGIDWLRSLRSLDKAKSIAMAIILLLVVSSLASPFLMINRWNAKSYVSGDGVIVEMDVFNIANYCGEQYGSELSMSNVAGLEGLIWSVSGVTFSGAGISSLLTGEVTPEEVRTGIDLSDARFPQNLYSWYEYDGDPLLTYFEMELMRRGIEYLCSGVSSSDSVFREYLMNHSRLVLYVDSNWPESYVTVYSDSYAKFLSELQNSESAYEYTAEPESVEFSGYLVYETGRSSVFIVQLPIPSC